MEDKQIILEELDQYIVLGRDKNGEYISAQSPNMQLQDMAGYLARAQIAMNIQCCAASRQPPNMPFKEHNPNKQGD